MDKAVNGHLLTFWEFQAVLADASSIQNGQFLGVITSVDGRIAVCPQDLLLGHSGHSTGAVYESTTVEGRVALCQEITRDFWQAWLELYFPALSRWTKWKQGPNYTPKKGDLILVLTLEDKFKHHD